MYLCGKNRIVMHTFRHFSRLCTFLFCAGLLCSGTVSALVPAQIPAQSPDRVQTGPVQGYVHESSTGYVWPEDSLVLRRLERWRDLKFGVLFHWGLYSIPGIVESWSICSEDVDWINRRRDLNYEDYKRWYWGLADSFRPAAFDPSRWAEIMEAAGMKYMIFTTKHHDGFCLFDSRLTDFTVANTPFGDNPRMDIARHVWDAFRKRDFMVGAYFSKPDWHSPYYWWDQYATPDRNVNYRIERHPERWEAFCRFTAGQIEELTTRYGDLDILWLDGGWVAPPRQDIGLDSIVARARLSQPGLLVVDRTIAGPNENYQTPERQIPEQQMRHPWESCIPLSNDWGWVPDAPYKSADRVIELLIEVVAKGGSLLLGVGPTADGRIEEPVVERLSAVGRWLETNGEAIYGSRPVDRYREGRMWFTGSKDGRTRYALYALPEGEELPDRLTWTGNLPRGRMILLQTGRPVRYRIEGDRVTVELPRRLRRESLVFSFTPEPDLRPEQQETAFVSGLIARMTLEEKAAQLCCLPGWEGYIREGDAVELTEYFSRALDPDAPVGAFWGVLRADPWTEKSLVTGLNPALSPRLLNEMQRRAVEETRLGIPLLFAEECVHGHMAIGTTVFPTGLLQASTWNPELLAETGRAVAQELRSQGAHLAFGPVLDVARELRWSRVEETLGEDPYLTAVLGSAAVLGMQGNPADRTAWSEGRGAPATLKHFAAYGVPRGGHNGNPADVGRRMLLDGLLPGFERAVRESAAAAVMTSYNSIDGIPCSANPWLTDTLLRRQWGFGGCVISDLYAVNGLVGARIAGDLTRAAALALRAGVDLDLGGQAYRRLPEAVRQGLVDEESVDRAVARVLRLKYRLGLFDHPYVPENRAAAVVHQPAHRELARELVRQGTVLLKNASRRTSEPVLPLSDTVRRIAVIGPNADRPYNQLGDYTAPQAPGKVSTVLDGLRTRFPDARIDHVRGCAVLDTTCTDLAAARAAAQAADVTVLVLGGSSARDFRTSYAETGAARTDDGTPPAEAESGEGLDRSSLRLTGDQEKLLEAVASAGRPLVVVYVQGRPLDMRRAAACADALLTVWYPGEAGGEALAEILAGDCEPGGRLPVSVPQDAGQLPVYAEQGVQRDYVDGPAAPLYPFGYGLGYTEFAYRNLSLEAVPEGIRVCFEVQNTGSRTGSDVPQVYVTDLEASVALPPLRLCAFEKIRLNPGESRILSLLVRREDLVYTGPDYRPVLEPGAFRVNVGASSADIRLSGTVSL